ncbi:MAG: DUF929 family protein [Thaumarchaeota archaeon]|nr:DUF929 family protein [Nitrososphaerota archaeon]
MRTQMKRRQRNRRIAVAASLLVVFALIGVVVYMATLAGQGSQLDSWVNQPVSTSDMAGLQAASLQPFGPSPTSAMQSAVHLSGGSSWNTAKPQVVYVGAEFCTYCALQRWALVMALSRFGDFSGLRYMTSGPNEGDLATFTFVGSTYSSSYITFKPYELADRSNPPRQLQTLPSNYSAIWNAYGGYPFMDFGNRYLVPGSLLVDESILQGKNWTSVILSISTSDGGGTQVRQAANLVTAVICKLTQGAPASVCLASPIDSTSTGIAGPVGGAQSSRGLPAFPAAPSPDRVIQPKHRGH